MTTNLDIRTVPTNREVEGFHRFEDEIDVLATAISKGPLNSTRRRTTDSIWIGIAFIVFFSMILGSILCFLYGDPGRLGTPHDSDRKKFRIIIFLYRLSLIPSGMV